MKQKMNEQGPTLDWDNASVTIEVPHIATATTQSVAVTLKLDDFADLIAHRMEKREAVSPLGDREPLVLTGKPAERVAEILRRRGKAT